VFCDLVAKFGFFDIGKNINGLKFIRDEKDI
jgi:hypothetical protein